MEFLHGGSFVFTVSLHVMERVESCLLCLEPAGNRGRVWWERKGNEHIFCPFPFLILCFCATASHHGIHLHWEWQPWRRNISCSLSPIRLCIPANLSSSFLSSLFILGKTGRAFQPRQRMRDCRAQRIKLSTRAVQHTQRMSIAPGPGWQPSILTLYPP